MNTPPTYLLSTATIPDGLIEEAADHNFVLEVIPFIDIEFLDMEILIPKTAVFTSVNAVRPSMYRTFPDVRIYCISGATYAAVVASFGEKSVVGTADSASELAALIGTREAGHLEEIVFFCGDHRRQELPSLGLTEKVVYRTILTPKKLERTYDGLAFFSPSAVESFFSVNSIADHVPLFSIGKTTESAIRSACSNPVITAGKPDKAVLIRDMIDYFQTGRSPVRI